MSDNLLKKLLDGKWINPDTGEAEKIPILDIIISKNLAAETKSIINRLNLGKKPFVVSDVNTHKALGKAIAEHLNVQSVVLPENTEPDENAILQIKEKTKDADFLIAVGSGTINDLCKYVSALEKKPYIIFGTAPSMNGYASANASLFIDGKKQSFPAQLPKAIFLDLDVLSKCPLRLIKSGLGDSICRPTSQADWLLSHLVLQTKYLKAPFELLQDTEKKLFSSAPDLINRDISAIEILANTLILSGIGMYLSGGSYPASQGEHMIAHYMETMQKDGEKTYHGEQIAVTTLEMAKIQERLLSIDSISLKKEFNKNDIINHFGKKSGDKYIKQSEKKKTDLNKIEKSWNEIKKEIKPVTRSHSTLKDILLSAEMSVTYDGLKWKEDIYKDAIKYSHLTRDRFTFLDIAFFADF